MQNISRLIGILLIGLLLAPWGQASIVHSPAFKVDGIVIVWGGGEVMTGGQSAHIGTRLSHNHTLEQPSLPLITGTLLPLEHASLIPLEVPAWGQTSFYVASNTAFQIDAELAAPAALPLDVLETLPFNMRVALAGQGPLETGQMAQYPHSGGAQLGFSPDIKSLADLHQRVNVFSGNQRTAARPGTIAQQSVEFIVEYGGTHAPSPQHAPSIIFTVFVP